MDHEKLERSFILMVFVCFVRLFPISDIGNKNFETFSSFVFCFFSSFFFIKKEKENTNEGITKNHNNLFARVETQ